MHTDQQNLRQEHPRKMRILQFARWLFARWLFGVLGGHPVGAEDDAANLIPFTLSDLNAYTDWFKVTNFLGYGGYGSVYRGTICGRQERKINGLQVAVKVSRSANTKLRIQWEAEKRYLSGMTHQNIIRLIGYCETPEKLYLVYPLMPNGDVKKKLPVLDWKTTLKIIKGVASAIEKLHNFTPPLIYRDLKPENILLDKDFTPKLADFGTVTQEGEHLKRGTAGYTDSEIMNGCAGSKHNDMYSFGVVILQLIMKKTDVGFRGCSLPVDIRDWARDSYTRQGDAVHGKLKRQGCPKCTAKAITELGLDCVKQNPLERPTIGEVLERLAKLDDN